MSIVTMHAAKANLSKLLARVEAGERSSLPGARPIARLTRIGARTAARRFGAMKGIVSVGQEFFQPMTEAELKEWE